MAFIVSSYVLKASVKAYFLLLLFLFLKDFENPFELERKDVKAIRLLL